MLTQITIEDENELAVREVFPKRINERILRQWQQTYLEKLLCLLQCFFFYRTNEGKIETTSRQTQCPVSKILQRYIKELKLTALIVLTEANLFLLSRKVFVMCYCFRAPIKTTFFNACQMIVKSCVLHLFPVPQTGRSHIINILLASRLGHKLTEENSVRNLQYGPKTRLIRGIHRKIPKIGPSMYKPLQI